MADLYSRLADMSLLRRAWHLARNDARSDFMFDSDRFGDVAFDLRGAFSGNRARPPSWFLYGLLHDRERGLDQVKSLFLGFREDVLLERRFSGSGPHGI